MQKILKHYLKRLTNLSSSNKSLLLLTLPAGQFFDLNELDFLNNKPSFELIAQLIAGKESIYLCDGQDSRFDKVNEASTILKKIDRTENFIEEERGARDLYVGYPMIRGKLSDGTLIRCPLLFFPVSLELRQNRWMLLQRTEEEITLNKSFLLAYAYFNNVTISDEWIETGFADFNADSRIFRTQLYELLKQSPLEINFNQDLFTDKLQSFQRFLKADFEAQEKTGELKLFPEAVLGIFPQAGSYLVPDYQILLQQNEVQSLEEFFLTKRQDTTTALPIKEEHTFTPFAIDASQENAIKAIKSGQSMVIQGPPGTGKSQLICNLIADYIARGKKVLLVCQKRVALDVVYDRLKESGLAQFSALVHDFKHDRKAIYEQIVSQIDKIDAYKEQNNSLDAIFLERTFLQESRQIDKLSQELEEFRQALFDAAECGLSVKELYLTSDITEPHLPLDTNYRHFTFENLSDFLQKLGYYQAYARQFETQDYPLKDRIFFINFSYTDLSAIIQAISQVYPFKQKIEQETEKICGKPLSIDQTEALQTQVESLQAFLHLFQNQTQWDVFLQLLSSRNQKAGDASWIETTERELTSYLQGVGIEKTIAPGELALKHQKLAKARSARSGLFSWLFWQWFSGDKKEIETLATANGLDLRQENLEILSQKIANRIAADELLGQLNGIRTIHNLYELSLVQEWFENQKKAIEAKKMAGKIPFLQQHPALLQLPLVDFQAKISALYALVEETVHTKKHWKNYLSDSQISRLQENQSLASILIPILQNDFDNLSELDRLKTEMLPVEQEITFSLWKFAENEPQETDIVALFDNSLRIAWINHIENKFPILRTVSTLKLEQTEKQLQESILKKMQTGQAIALLKAREQTYRDLEYNRLGNLVTYRELKHQTSKKRHIWQMRRLFSAFSAEIFRLIPCWMASPESVSAIFQMEQLFDLVIFDEASQCFAERGIPAIYRGNQIVVTGDSQQLPPGDIYRVRFEDTTEDIPELEVDSLLDLAAQYFPQIQLNGHYRSQSLELIDFSNKHFYKNTLQLLPDRHQINSREPAIRYIKVEGIWQNNTNQIEAQEVVECVHDLASRYPEKSIGIVTFNFMQQQLIQDLLEEQAQSTGKSWPASLFVKNIENVQGDERDIIIFSIGYAPDAKGKLAMQFGSLNMQGGENRLNVAVTRAREQIIMISSILPVQLKTEDTLHKGPKLLKQYLEYAWQVSEGAYIPIPKPVENFRASLLLKDQLPAWSDNLKKELPFADLTVKQQDMYHSLVLTDDDLYFQSLSTKDAHAYTPFLLKKKNWPFVRVYSREYWRDKQKLQEKVVK
ncbi:DUF4011 domain-containing protein [Rhodocytophaga rosea]|uniref:DUF4011 domain-containing protein n=1 Tax=Rhodocytophaga rosea TaxID=2704465 RepID=A0A6C0GMF3_9BACT|nr:AAA domain-containing protein [Rhodocytophaga rosea]QHT69117.1 DUF4011 domain-containing protein [Rhodocytophaga rosea]